MKKECWQSAMGSEEWRKIPPFNWTVYINIDSAELEKKDVESGRVRRRSLGEESRSSILNFGIVFGE